MLGDREATRTGHAVEVAGRWIDIADASGQTRRVPVCSVWTHRSNATVLRSVRWREFMPQSDRGEPVARTVVIENNGTVSTIEFQLEEAFNSVRRSGFPTPTASIASSTTATHRRLPSICRRFLLKFSLGSDRRHMPFERASSSSMVRRTRPEGAQGRPPPLLSFRWRGA